MFDNSTDIDTSIVVSVVQLTLLFSFQESVTRKLQNNLSASGQVTSPSPLAVVVVQPAEHVYVADAAVQPAEQSAIVESQARDYVLVCCSSVLQYSFWFLSLWFVLCIYI